MSDSALTILSSVLSSMGVTAAGAWWLGREWIQHRLAEELENKKAVWQGEVKKKIENELADSAAQRNYEYTAKARLYTAIGPLRFQLLGACRDLAHHIQMQGLQQITYSMEPTGYYGKSTLYRIIRPVTVAELIERQISVVDFSVDLEAVDLLRFKTNVFRALCDDRPILNHPDEDWNYTKQHLFSHLVAKMANALAINADGTTCRPMYFQEFEKYLSEPESQDTIGPLISIVRDFRIEDKPIFWIRLVFYGYVCTSLVNKLGVKIGFERINYDPSKLLALSHDKFTRDHSTEMCAEFERLLHLGL